MFAYVHDRFFHETYSEEREWATVLGRNEFACITCNISCNLTNPLLCMPLTQLDRVGDRAIQNTMDYCMSMVATYSQHIKYIQTFKGDGIIIHFPLF